MNEKIIALRMERQFFHRHADKEEYDQLYRDMQPGQNLYWNGFGEPPIILLRANFDDKEYNKERQLSRILTKGRFQNGNIGWVLKDDLEIFACMYKKTKKLTYKQELLLDLIKKEGPLTIQHMKESTGMLVKEITPVLHSLQEMFFIYEDQHDGEWDRGWYRFEEMFPNLQLSKYTRKEALMIILKRFSYRHVLFDIKMAKSFYKLPEKDIHEAVMELINTGVFVKFEDGYMLKTDYCLLDSYSSKNISSVIAIHKNDFLYKSYEHILKEKYKREGIETLFYLLIDGQFHGAAYGKFRYGPPDFDDVYIDLPNEECLRRKKEFLEALKVLSFDKYPDKYNGKPLI